MERLLLEQLIEWKQKPRRKPLIIHGARQVGKTWLMKEFGKICFQQTAYISFDNNEPAKSIFELDFDVSRVISALKIASGVDIQPENTLIVFDEIQEAPKAITALKYFCENAPEYYVIAAGSLLGMALHQGTSFPVGKVEFLHLFPLTFREFLTAAGEKGLASILYSDDYEMINVFSGKYADLLRKYYYIGGMPEAVQCWLDTDNMQEVRSVQKQLLLYYENDFSKHAPAEKIPRIQMVWNSIPAQLAKENKKFIYGVIREGARAKDFEIAIQWLSDYGLIYKSYCVSKPGMPLAAYKNLSIFKIYLLDVGLLSAMGNIPAQTLIQGNRIFEEFKGALTEQYAAQELAAHGFDLFYYSSDNSAEVDFLVQKEALCIPVEVKAEENLRAQSLRAYCRKYDHSAAIRTSMANYREESWMSNVPLYWIGEYLTRLSPEAKQDT